MYQMENISGNGKFSMLEEDEKLLHNLLSTPKNPNSITKYMTKRDYKKFQCLCIIFMTLNVFLFFFLYYLFNDLIINIFLLVTGLSMVGLICLCVLTYKPYIFDLIMLLEFGILLLLKIYINIKYVKFEYITLVCTGISTLLLIFIFIFLLLVRKKDEKTKLKKYIALYICLVYLTISIFLKTFIFYYISTEVLIFIINLWFLYSVAYKRFNGRSFKEFYHYVLGFILILIFFQDVFDNIFVAFPYLKNTMIKNVTLTTIMQVFIGEITKLKDLISGN